MKTYQALESVKTEEGNVISVVEKNVGELPEGDLLIKVSYSSLNYKDSEITRASGLHRRKEGQMTVMILVM